MSLPTRRMIGACLPMDPADLPELLPEHLRDRLPSPEDVPAVCAFCWVKVWVSPGLARLDERNLVWFACYGCAIRQLDNGPADLAVLADPTPACV